MSAGAKVCWETRLPSGKTGLEVIVRLREKVVAAVNAGDVEKYVSLFDGGAVIMPPNQSAVSGTGAVRVWAQALFGQFNVHVTVSPEELLVADLWDFERHLYTLVLTPKAGGNPMVHGGKAVVVYRRQSDGSWKGYIDCWDSNGPRASTHRECS